MVKVMLLCPITHCCLVLQCDNDGEIEYEFPCFNQVETLDGLWEKVDPRYTDGVYGGVRLRSPAPTQYILPPIYVRLQVCHALRHRASYLHAPFNHSLRSSYYCLHML